MLAGVSGSGKGSVGEWLLERAVIATHASMGAWLRAAIAHPATLEGKLEALQLQPPGFTPLQYLGHCVTNGLLIPDAWTQAVIEAQLGRAPHGTWALDGYPRTPGAASHLLAALHAADIPLLGVVELHLPQTVVMQRLLARGRVDDIAAAIRQRLEFYAQSVVPTLKWLHSQGVRVHRVDADRPLETVALDVKTRLGL